MDDNRLGLILMLLREGNTRQAVKAYQEEANVDYAVARAEVLDLARRHGAPVRHRLMLHLTLLALAGLLGLMLSL